MAWYNSSSAYQQYTVGGAADQPLTFMAWVRYVSTASQQYLIGTYSTGACIKTNAGGTTVVYGTNRFDNTGSTIPPNTWCHLAMTASFAGASDITIQGYFNGKKEVAANSTAFTYSDWTSLIIGNNNSLGGPTAFNGYIREARIWYRVLTDSEIQREYLSAEPVAADCKYWLPLKTNVLDQKSGQLWVNNSSSLSPSSMTAVYDSELPLRSLRRPRKFILP